MRIEQGGRTRRPLSVNDQFFAGVASLIEEVKDAALKIVAHEHGLPPETARSIADAPVGERRTPRPPTHDLSVEEIAREYEIRDSEYRAEAIRRDLRVNFAMHLNLNMSDGYSFQPTDLEELKDIISREPGRPESLSIRVGSGYRSLSFGLRLMDNAIRTAAYDVSGERKEAENIYRRITDLLRASEPDHTWLHSLWFDVLLSVVTSGATTLAIIIIGGRLIGGVPLYLGVIGVVVGLLMQHIASRQLHYAFPKCQFEYGPTWRHQKARRTLFFALLSLILIPLAISAIV